MKLQKKGRSKRNGEEEPASGHGSFEGSVM